MSNRNGEGCMGICLLAGLVFAVVIASAHFEARAFNRATGSNVSAFDAIWVNLRVDAPAK